MNLVLQLGALCVALGAIGIVGRFLYRFIRRMDAFLSDWNGEAARPGRERIPSMPERMTGVEKRLTQVETAINNA